MVLYIGAVHHETDHKSERINNDVALATLNFLSNSIYKDGYADALQHDARVATFVKYSMGPSPSVIIPYFGSVIDFSQFDCVIFETAINDRNYQKYGSIRKEQIRRFLEWGIRAASSAGCHAALLVMPGRKDMNRQTVPGIIYQRIAARTGATFLTGSISSAPSPRRRTGLSTAFSPTISTS